MGAGKKVDRDDDVDGRHLDFGLRHRRIAAAAAAAAEPALESRLHLPALAPGLVQDRFVDLERARPGDGRPLCELHQLRDLVHDALQVVDERLQRLSRVRGSESSRLSVAQVEKVPPQRVESSPSPRRQMFDVTGVIEQALLALCRRIEKSEGVFVGKRAGSFSRRRRRRRRRRPLPRSSSSNSSSSSSFLPARRECHQRAGHVVYLGDGVSDCGLGRRGTSRRRRRDREELEKVSFFFVLLGRADDDVAAADASREQRQGQGAILFLVP